MKTVSLIQGSPEWHAHRRAHWNASDAPAMLGVSPYKSRVELLREYATGVAPDVDSLTQKRFDDGHRFESLARAEAERIVGEELFPCVGVAGKYSASFDGLTLLEETAFEHKTLNAQLVRAFAEIKRGGSTADAVCAHLPEHFRVQLEHQLLVIGGGRVLFMASDYDRDGNLLAQHHCWYVSDMAMRERIIAGWQQFERDLAAFQPELAAPPKPIGRTPETLPALRIEARGMVTASNLDQFREHAMAVLGGIKRELVTDDDFADAESTVKWCKDVEGRLESAKAGVLGQMADVDAVCRTIDDVAAETRRIRLELDRLVKAEKEARKEGIVREGVEAVRAHYAEVNSGLPREHAIGVPASLAGELGASIKGLKTLASMRGAIDAAVAAAKIRASQVSALVQRNLETLRAAGHAQLFADAATLAATKAPEDLRNLVAARIAEHERREAERERIRQQAEAERLERERERIRAEEQAKARVAAEAQEPKPEAPREEAPPRSASVRTIAKEPEPAPGLRIKLGEINAAIAPLSISADGLARLGIHPAATEKAAKLYDASDWRKIREAIFDVVARAELRRDAA